MYGKGVNDAPYTTSFTDAQGKEHRCPFYQKWKSLLQRIFDPKFQAQWPTYIGCTIDPDWLIFTRFRDWMERQDWQGKDLDKDLLQQGNKHYGPETCLFIDQAINKLLCVKGRARGDLPLGVSYTTVRGKTYIVAFCSFYAKPKNLGRFPSIEAAYEAYKKAKLAYAAELAANEPNPKIKQALLRLHFEMD